MTVVVVGSARGMKRAVQKLRRKRKSQWLLNNYAQPLPTNQATATTMPVCMAYLEPTTTGEDRVRLFPGSATGVEQEDIGCY